MKRPVYQDLRVASSCIFSFRVRTDPVPKTYCCDKFYYFEHETMNEIQDLNACKLFNQLSVILAHDSYRNAQSDMLPLLRFKEGVLRNIIYVTDPLFFPVALRPIAGHGLLILEVSLSHTATHHSRQDFSGRVISSSQRPLPDNIVWCCGIMPQHQS